MKRTRRDIGSTDKKSPARRVTTERYPMNLHTIADTLCRALAEIIVAPLFWGVRTR